MLSRPSYPKSPLNKFPSLQDLPDRRKGRASRVLFHRVETGARPAGFPGPARLVETGRPLKNRRRGRPLSAFRAGRPLPPRGPFSFHSVSSARPSSPDDASARISAARLIVGRRRGHGFIFEIRSGRGASRHVRPQPGPTPPRSNGRAPAGDDSRRK